MKASGIMCYCKTCNKTMDANNFYRSNRIDRYPPHGYLDECKQCLTRHVDGYDPETFKWILEAVDVPYYIKEWNNMLNKFGKKGARGTSVLGHYLSIMRMSQYKKYRWVDTDPLNTAEEERQKAAMADQGFSEEEISAASEKNMALAERPPEAAQSAPGSAMIAVNPTIDDYAPELAADLTEEDKQYLALKWGPAYKPYEWVHMEQYYNDMMDAFDIQTPAHIDYLKMICKTSLKAHQLLDMNDIEGYQKMSKVYDSLMRSAQFTAAQNREESGDFVNSINEFAALCEKEGGFIPRFYVNDPNDKVDETLRDSRSYTRSLVMNELNLGALIETSVKQLERDKENESDNSQELFDDEDDIFSSQDEAAAVAAAEQEEDEE